LEAIGLIHLSWASGRADGAGSGVLQTEQGFTRLNGQPL
jgi:hypothetical protein